MDENLVIFLVISENEYWKGRKDGRNHQGVVKNSLMRRSYFLDNKYK